MALNPLIIESDYFTNIQNRRGLMRAADFDAQFNNIVNYLNSQVVFLLRKLVADSVPGSIDPDKVNTYLHNVGDKTTEWINIDYSTIPDYSLRYEQLAQTNPCSILATGLDQIFKAVMPTDNRQILVSQDNSIPSWQKITAANIDDRAVISSKINLGSLLNDNFQPNVLSPLLQNDSVITALIADNTITSDKIANGAVTEQVLGQGVVDQLCGRNGSKVILWGNTLPDGFIDSPFLLKLPSFGEGVKDANHTINYTKLAVGFKIPPSCYYNGGGGFDGVSGNAFNGANIDDNSIQSYQIMQRSLNGQRLCFLMVTVDTPTLVRGINELIEDGSIGIENLPPDYRAKLGL
jgi:hypothetical protein